MSKFSGLREARNEAAPAETPAAPAAPDVRAPGRPKAKRSDPEFMQVTAYVRRSTYMKVKFKLLQQDDREFSDAVEELLQKWVNEDAN